jgi:hypothetical protein
MTKKFDNLFESILGDLAASATLTPVGPITVTQEPADGDCNGRGCGEAIADEVSETEIATKIIEKAIKLRKKIGEDSYHYIRSIIDLAERLLEMHPDIEIIEPQGEE